MKAAVQVKIISVQEALHRRSRVAGSGASISQQQQQPTRISGPQIKGSATPPPSPVMSSASYGGKGKGMGNPCLDLCFHLVLPKEEDEEVNPLGHRSREYLNQLLPLAWSHNPLTTLKLIVNFLDREDEEREEEAFYTAAYWLHQNHPKTLASNLCNLHHTDDFPPSTYCKHLFEMMHRIRLLEVEKGRQDDPDAAENYLSLHNGVSDHLARCFEYNLEILSNKQKQYSMTEWGYCQELYDADDYVPQLRYSMTNHTVLCQSIASKIFPRESSPEEYQGLDDEDYSWKVLERLEDEILVPLERLVDTGDFSGCQVGVWDKQPLYVVEQLKKKAAESLGSAEEAGDDEFLLPNEIIRNVTDSELGEAAELQWKTMVEDYMYSGNRLSNCLAVFDPRGTAEPYVENNSLALTLLVSELAHEEPWKGKVISFGPKPQLLTIQGHNLRSKQTFLKGLMDPPDLGGDVMDFGKVFDLILQVAVNENLKPDQMIKRVLVFSIATLDDDDVSSLFKWETTHDYEAIKSRFRGKGYVVPQLVFWSLAGCMYTPQVRCSSKNNGVVILSGCSYYLVKSFLDNHGDIGLDHVMEAAITGKEYDKLVLLD